jgi:nucleoid-associated protein YgaU
LGFHPSCPVCRWERLFGPLPSEPVVSRRAQAVLAGGVLAFSMSAPAVAIAYEPDRRGEGVEVPEDPGAGELHDPGFDPGGETALPFETAPVPPTPPAAGDQDDGAAAPLEVEPQDDPDVDLVPPTEPDAPVAYGPVAPEEATPVPPAVVVIPDATPVPAQPGPEALAPEPPTEQPSRPDTVPRRPDRPNDKERSQPSESISVESGVGTSEEPVTPPVAVPEPDPVVVMQADVPHPERPEGSLQRGRSYAVQRGDSLWSIAKRLLGRDATPAQIAREVSRLWSLNEGRIGTGDPDLLMVGTHLSLR